MGQILMTRPLGEHLVWLNFGARRGLFQSEGTCPNAKTKRKNVRGLLKCEGTFPRALPRVV